MPVSHDINLLRISGRLIKPIEHRQCPNNGKSVADFIMVSNRKHLPKDHPDRARFATRVKVTLWNEDAEYWSGNNDSSTILEVGDEVLVEGQLFNDDFVPKGSDLPTSGRSRIDNVVFLKLLKKAPAKVEGE